MKLFICPICGTILTKSQKQYTCEKNHTYDRAKSGYVNLLMDSMKNSKIPGDNKLMVTARNNFLNNGYYSILLNNLCKTVEKFGKEDMIILDVGCGEGYYTEGLYTSLKDKFQNIYMGGVDISKLALEKAGKRSKEIDFVVASGFHIPVRDNSFDIVLNLFAPYCGEEYTRVLNSDGTLILVIPSENHLWELKKIVYPTPYKNDPKDYNLEGFTLLEKVHVTDIVDISSNEDVLSLFSMTPYYYKTAKQDYEKLLSITNLKTTIDFEILIYKVC